LPHEEKGRGTGKSAIRAAWGAPWAGAAAAQHGRGEEEGAG
jgi:hypothetical protein